MGKVLWTAGLCPSTDFVRWEESSHPTLTWHPPEPGKSPKSWERGRWAVGWMHFLSEKFPHKNAFIDLSCDFLIWGNSDAVQTLMKYLSYWACLFASQREKRLELLSLHCHGWPAGKDWLTSCMLSGDGRPEATENTHVTCTHELLNLLTFIAKSKVVSFLHPNKRGLRQLYTFI